MPSSLMTAWCTLYNSPIVALIIGGVVMFFFGLIAIEGGSRVVRTWPVKILVGCCGMVSVTSLLAGVFNIRVAC